MINKLQTLYKKKKDLEERIRISEIGNDSYYLSPLYKIHRNNLYDLNKTIETLENKKKLVNR